MKRFFLSILFLLISTTIANSASSVGNIETRVTALEAQNVALMDLLAGASRIDDTLVLEGMNLQIVNGLGATDGDQGSGPQVNGLGNLIVDYDENSSNSEKSGSDSLVVGTMHSHSSYGGLLGGRHNTVSGPYATVSGGIFNIAHSNGSRVSGGSWNTASGEWSSISGGDFNIASGHRSGTLDGSNNVTTHQRSVVLGGNGNVSTADDSIDPLLTGQET